MDKTMIQQLFATHTAPEASVEPGDIIWLDLDVRTARDFGGANVVQNYREHYGDAPVADPTRTFFTFDLVAPPSNIPYANNQQLCREWARSQGIRVYDVNAGIGSHVAIEEGLVHAGDTFVGTDSHLNILGAIGAFGQGMGDQDIAFAFKSGRTWFEVPPTMKVVLHGTLRAPCTARDLTLASQVTEMGGIIGFPISEAIPASLLPDHDAGYIESIEIDITELEPLIACPPNPANVHPVRELAGKRIDSVFLGSCTNGRFEDFAAVAAIVKGHQLAPHVMATVVPATRRVYAQLLASGVLETLFEAGFIISNPGCGGCASGHLGMTGKGEVQVSTSNRNFPGKQGAGQTYLASPVTAAWSALRGEITVPEVRA